MLKGWRTILINAALAVLGILETADFTDLLSESAIGYVLLGVSVLNMILRKMTTTPVGTSK